MIGVIFLFRCMAWISLFLYYAVRAQDCYPFLNLPTEVEVPEDTYGGSVVFDIALADPFFTEYTAVFDPDVGAQYFLIDFHGNTVSLLPGVKLDYESRAVLKIHFIENITIGKECTLVLNITDVNEPPVFSKDVYYFSVLEGQIGTPLSQLNATDPDVNDNLHFEMTSLEGQEIVFSINFTTQTLSFVDDFDFNVKRLPDLVCIYVTVYDDRGLSDSTFLVIKIIGVNDNVPQFIYPQFSLFLPQSTPTGAIVHRVHAIDFDDDVIRYELMNVTADGSQYFHVKSDGEITLERKLDTEQSMELLVIADDGGQIQSTATVTVVIISCGSVNNTSSARKSTVVCKDKGDDAVILCGTIPILMFFCSSGVIVTVVLMWKKKKKYEVKIFPEKS